MKSSNDSDLGEPNASHDESTGSGAENRATPAADMNSSDASKSEETTNREEAGATSDESPKADESQKPDTNSSGATPGSSGSDNSSTGGSTSAQNIEDYYRYRYEPIDSRYGDNQTSATERETAPATPSNNSADVQNSDEGMANGDDDTDDDGTASDADLSEDSSLTGRHAGRGVALCRGLRLQSRAEHVGGDRSVGPDEIAQPSP